MIRHLLLCAPPADSWSPSQPAMIFFTSHVFYFCLFFRMVCRLLLCVPSAGCWSPSRPAVIYLTDQAGNLEIWDMLDRSHEPSIKVRTRDGG